MNKTDSFYRVYQLNADTPDYAKGTLFEFGGTHGGGSSGLKWFPYKPVKSYELSKLDLSVQGFSTDNISDKKWFTPVIEKGSFRMFPDFPKTIADFNDNVTYPQTRLTGLLGQLIHQSIETREFCSDYYDLMKKHYEKTVNYQTK